MWMGNELLICLPDIDDESAKVEAGKKEAKANLLRLQPQPAFFVCC